MKLETYITKKGDCAGTYVSFPTTRKALRKLVQELKRLERFEENSDILDNITYIVELVSKMTPM